MALTLVSWNVETLAPKLARLPELLARLDHPDVLCLQEVRIRHHDAELVAQLEGALPGYVCHHSLARDPKNVTFRGGRAYGVATYLREGLGPMESEVPAWDLEGRLVLSRLASLTIRWRPSYERASRRSRRALAGRYPRRSAEWRIDGRPPST